MSRNMPIEHLATVKNNIFTFGVNCSFLPKFDLLTLLYILTRILLWHLTLENKGAKIQVLTHSVQLIIDDHDVYE